MDNKRILVITLSDESNCKTKEYYFKDVPEEWLDRIDFHYRRGKDFEPVEDELKKRPHAVLIDGRLADSHRFEEWDFRDIMNTIFKFDMPINLFSFVKPTKLPGVQPILKPMKEFIAEQLG